MIKLKVMNTLCLLLICSIDFSTAFHFTKDMFKLNFYNQDKIRVDLRYGNMTSMSADILEGADQTQTLRIDYNPDFDFPDSKEAIKSKYLQYFYSTHNSISSIYEETFRLIPAIDSIYLDYNKIEQISPLAFNENILLKSLRLSNNNINKFVFKHIFPSLEELHLNNNLNLNFVRDRPFLESPELQRLNISYCGIKTIYMETFKELPKITMIDFSNNLMENIHKEAFLNNCDLQELYFDNNPLMSISFKSKSLTMLTCNNCNISVLDIETFQDLINLKVLELNNNKIKQITSYSFFYGLLLSSISLEGNEIETIDVKSIDYLTELRSFCLDFNPLVPSYEMTQFLQYYRSSCLRRNCLSTNPSQFFEEVLPIINVKHFFIVNSSTIHPDWIDSNEMNITNMNLTYIEPMLFENKSNFHTLILNENYDYKFLKDSPFLFNKFLIKFQCQYCGIDKIYKKTFIGVPNLRELIISNNSITELYPGIFDNNKQLERLDLSNNKLHKIIYLVLDAAENLFSLSMDNNKNFDFEPKRIFLYNENLQNFSCNCCGIKQIFSETFEKLRKLRYLYLNNNSIEAIDKNSFRNNKILEAIYLDGNRLIVFDVSIVYNLPSLVLLCLDNNMNYNFSYSENNANLKTVYKNRRLRSKDCTSNTFDENLLPLITTSTYPPTTSQSTSTKQNAVEFMKQIKETNYIKNSSSTTLHSTLFIVMTIFLIITEDLTTPNLNYNFFKIKI